MRNMFHGSEDGNGGGMTLVEQVSLLKRQRDYLARTARIFGWGRYVDEDTTEYEPDKEAVELFGEKALYFVVGCGPTPTHYSLITKEVKP